MLSCTDVSHRRRVSHVVQACTTCYACIQHTVCVGSCCMSGLLTMSAMMRDLLDTDLAHNSELGNLACPSTDAFISSPSPPPSPVHHRVLSPSVTPFPPEFRVEGMSLPASAVIPPALFSCTSLASRYFSACILRPTLRAKPALLPNLHCKLLYKLTTAQMRSTLVIPRS